MTRSGRGARSHRQGLSSRWKAELSAHRLRVMLPPDTWRSEIESKWAGVATMGTLLAALGVVGVTLAYTVTRAGVFIHGLLLLGGAAAHGVQMFRVFGWRNLLVQGLLTLLYLAASASVMSDPVGSSIRLTLVIALFLVIAGLLRIVGGIDARHLPGWHWVPATGVADVLLGIALLSSWPASGLWFIGLAISLDILFSGIGLVILSWRLYRTVASEARSIAEQKR